MEIELAESNYINDDIEFYRPLAAGQQERHRRRSWGWGWRLPEERKRQEDAKTSDDLQQFAAAAVKQAVPADAVPRVTRARRARGQPRTHADTGQLLSAVCSLGSNH